jgi:hypothetical protein
VAGPDGRLITYSPARLARLTESLSRSRTDSLMEPDDLGDTDDIDLDLDDGSDDEHTQHLSRAAAAIFNNRSLSSDQKLAKLRLLLKVSDAGEEPDDGEGEPGEDLPPEVNTAEAAIRRMYRQLRGAPRDRDPRSRYAQAFPGLAMLGGGVAIISEGRRPRKGGTLTTQRFLEALERGR